MRRLKALAQAEPDALTRVLLLLEVQNLVPSSLMARCAPVRGRNTPVLEIEIEFAAADLPFGEFRRLVATIAELLLVLTVVAPDAPD